MPQINRKAHQEKNDFKENDLVCYCFQHTRKQIEKDYTDNGRSMILEKITLEKKLVDVIGLGRIQKGADVWPASTRWWTIF